MAMYGLITKAILEEAVFAGKVLLALSNPRFTSAIRDFKKLSTSRANKKIRDAARYLDKRGYVKLKWTEKGIVVIITQRGKKKIEKLSIEALDISKQDPWDKKWRVVIFDVPVNRNKYRRAFSDHLKHLGFKMIQKSVWIHPYPCHKQVMLLREWYSVTAFVTYLETSEVEDDEVWKKKFNL